MTRQFGIASRETPSKQSPDSLRKHRRISFRPTVDPFFPRGNASQLMLDVFTLIFGALFVCIFTAAISIAIYWLIVSVVG